MASYEHKYPDWKERIVNASESTDSAAGAAALLGIKVSTYKNMLNNTVVIKLINLEKAPLKSLVLKFR